MKKAKLFFMRVGSFIKDDRVAMMVAGAVLNQAFYSLLMGKVVSAIIGLVIGVAVAVVTWLSMRKEWQRAYDIGRRSADHFVRQHMETADFWRAKYEEEQDKSNE